MGFIDALIESIQELCEEKNISINMLAKRSGITQSTIDSILKGKSKNPTMNTIGKLAKGFDMPYPAFYSYVSNKERPPAEYVKALASRVYNLRTESGATAKEVADAIKIEEWDYIYIESAYPYPSVHTIVALADYFKVSTDYLLGRTDESRVR